MSEWQKIETAPKVGTQILCWDGKNRAICNWFDDNWDVIHDAQDHVWSHYTPTHWTPLLEPPKEVPSE